MAAPTFTWSVENMERSVSTGCVSILHWRVTATDGVHTLSHYSTVSLPPKDPSDPTFVAFANVTKAIAIGWAKGEIGAVTVKAHEDGLTQELANLAAPTTEAGVPWA